MRQRFGQSGNITIITITFTVLLITGLVIYRRISNQTITPPQTETDASASATVSSTPSASLKPTVTNSKTPSKTSPTSVSPLPAGTASQPAPNNTAQPAGNSTGSSPNIVINSSCSLDHDNLGKHIDVTVKFENLDKLNSNDLIVSTIDSTNQSRSESHISTSLINNQSIPMHKYVYAFQGSTVPLELQSDGREYIIRISKATYKENGEINVYEQALQTKFSKKCDL